MNVSEITAQLYAIGKGREDGIDDAYITPLVVVKAAMTENLLTKQVTA